MRRVRRRAVMTANSSPPRRATRSSPRRDAVEPQRDVADQLVADRVAERVVDVLEMVEVDVEHRGGRSAGLTSAMTVSSRSPKKLRFGSPHSGSCSAR